jgi:hypothetical protein
MTESEWRDNTDPEPLLDYLGSKGRISDRKLTLFAVAVCRRLEHLLTSNYVHGCREAIDMRERYADGLVRPEEVQAIRVKAVGDAVDAAAAIVHPGDLFNYAASCAAEAVARGGDSTEAARAIAFDTLGRADDPTVAAITAWWQRPRWEARHRWNADEARVVDAPDFVAAHAAERAVQAVLLRDIFGNPFVAPSRIDAAWFAWNQGTVRRLAQSIHAERAFDRMGILADALEESGCQDQDILRHCREQGGVHVCGCWVLDLLLNKE